MNSRSEASQLFSEYSDVFTTEVSTLEDDLDRSKKLIHDAVNELQNSFGGLSDQANVQLAMIMKLIEKTSDSTGDDNEEDDNIKMGFGEFALETNTLLDFFVKANYKYK